MSHIFNFFWCDVAGSKLFNQFCVHTRLSSHRGGVTCRGVVCGYSRGYFQFCMIQLQYPLAHSSSRQHGSREMPPKMPAAIIYICSLCYSVSICEQCCLVLCAVSSSVLSRPLCCLVLCAVSSSVLSRPLCCLVLCAVSSSVLSRPLCCLVLCAVSSSVLSRPLCCLVLCGVSSSVLSRPLCCLVLCAVSSSVLSRPLCCLVLCAVSSSVLSRPLCCLVLCGRVCTEQRNEVNLPITELKYSTLVGQHSRHVEHNYFGIQQLLMIPTLAVLPRPLL